MGWKSHATVEGGRLNLADAVPLPDGTEVTVLVEPILAGPATQDSADEDFGAIFGMWADRPELDDSVAWVKREREKWQQRLTRPD